MAAASKDHVEKVFLVLQGVSFLTTTFVKQQLVTNNGTYPAGFVTIPDSDVLLGDVLDKTGAVMVAYAPRISTQEEYTLWNQYVQENWSQQTSALDLGDFTSGGDRADAKTSTIESSDMMPSDQIWRLQGYDDSAELIEDDFWFCRFGTVKHIAQKDEEIVNGTILTPLWSVLSHADNATADPINWNALSDPSVRRAVQVATETNHITFQDMTCTNPVFWTGAAPSFGSGELQTLPPLPSDDRNLVAVAPVFDEFPIMEEGTGIDTRGAVGYLIAIIPWTVVFHEAFTNGINPIHVVVEDECQDDGDGALFTLTLQVPDDEATCHIGPGDVHDDVEALNAMKRVTHLSAWAWTDDDGGNETVTNPGWCIDGGPASATSRYTVVVYPAVEFQESSESNKPAYFAVIVILVFLCTAAAFMIFNWVVARNQRRLLLTARKQNAIVSSLFPKSVQKQLMEDAYHQEVDRKKATHQDRWDHRELESRSYASGMSSNTGDGSNRRSKPIADLFPETTIMFGDLVGFTRWSSVREPSQVFLLLESIYSEFDAVAKRRRVYKVEVVGDCYVAVCGLPDPRKNHAVVMAKFAMSCLDRLDVTTQKLMAELGPETAELKLRIGLHSGPVVAGVLRGDRSRFQLFGDAMNTASRMESTGLPNRVQVSPETARRLEAAGKGEWLKARSAKVLAKGKGEMQTYFLSITHRSSSSGARTLMDGSVHDV